MRAINRSRPPAVRALATLAVAVLIGATGCVSRAPVVQRTDAAITEDVRARLAADEQTKPFAITVATTAGVVHVSGSVARSADRESVERIARDTPGVRSVDNHVRYGGTPVPVDDGGA
jgi:osmotically-inducible protein OsmY